MTPDEDNPLGDPLGDPEETFWAETVVPVHDHLNVLTALEDSLRRENGLLREKVETLQERLDSLREEYDNLASANVRLHNEMAAHQGGLL